MGGVFLSLFKVNQEKDELESVKSALSHGVRNYEMAYGIEMASHALRITEYAELFWLTKPAVLYLSDWQEKIQQQKSSKGILMLARDLLASEDPVLSYTVAVSLSHLFHHTPHVDIGKKSHIELQALSGEPAGKLLVRETKQKIDTLLTARNDKMMGEDPVSMEPPSKKVKK